MERCDCKHSHTTQYSFGAFGYITQQSLKNTNINVTHVLQEDETMGVQLARHGGPVIYAGGMDNYYPCLLPLSHDHIYVHGRIDRFVYSLGYCSRGIILGTNKADRPMAPAHLWVG